MRKSDKKSFIQKRWKAIVGFLGAFVTSLAAIVQVSGKLTWNELLVALAGAVVTGGVVHQTPNA